MSYNYIPGIPFDQGTLYPPNACNRLIPAIMDAACIDRNGKPVKKEPGKNFARDFANGYDEYVSYGKVQGALQLPNTRMKYLIEDYMKNMTAADNKKGFAEILAAYWASVLITPDPSFVFPSTISTISVVNDANTLQSIARFEKALEESEMTKEYKPWYFLLIWNIQEIAISQITWTFTCIPTPTGGIPVHTRKIGRRPDKKKKKKK